MTRIKSALEIAMEKTNNLDQEMTADEIRMVKREKAKPLLASFYKGELEAEDLWQQINEKGDQELLGETQLALLESLGLKITEQQFKRRSEGILALETLKEAGNSSLVEQVLNQLKKLKQRYEQELEQLKTQIKEMQENNSEMKMRPVRTKDGRTVMQLQSDIDEEMKSELSKRISNFEKLYNSNFNQIRDELYQEF